MRLARGQLPHEQLITLRTAHDVRRLRTCPGCGGIGHSDAMVFAWPHGKDADAYYHGRCFVAEFGFDALAGMPEENKKLSLGDLGVDLMRRLVAHAH